MLRILCLLILLTTGIAATTAQVVLPENKPTAAPAKPRPKPAKPAVATRPTTSPPASPPIATPTYARLVVTTDLDVKINVNGVKTYTVRTADELFGIGLDKGINILRVTPADGGNEGYTEKITISDPGNREYAVTLGAKRRATVEARAREAEQKRQAEQRAAEENRQRLQREAEARLRQEQLALEQKQREAEQRKKEAAEQLRRTAIVRAIDSSMTAIEGGSFIMGIDEWSNPGLRPQHSVRVRNFRVSRFEVTQEQWWAVMNSRPSLSLECDRCPVESVSWEDVQTFLRELNRLTGRRYRLPTEAEWEYAARGGRRARGYNFAGSNEAAEVAWYRDNSGGGTKPVGTLRANELGLFDFAGNVQEWVQDCWHSDYTGASVDGTAWLAGGDCSKAVVRGGAWNFQKDWDCFLPERRSENKNTRGWAIGFRLAEDLP